MNLDQFRDVDLVIDKANDNFIQRQFVSQGDYKGRTMTVQVTDNGEVGEIPGLFLNLRWQNQSAGNTDLTAFTLIDKENSIFRIEYPTHMMTPGKVIASIQLIHDGKTLHMKQFELRVQKLAGEMIGIVDKVEYSALVAVLSDANKFRTDIDVLGRDKADKEDLTVVDNKVKNVMSSKVDKGGAAQISWGMLDQNTKEQIAGDKVAIVGPDSVGNVNVIDRSLKAVKLSESVNMVNYPFVNQATVDQTINKAIKDIRLHEFDRKKKYCLAVFRKNYGTNNVTQLMFYEANGDTGFGPLVCTFYRENYMPSQDVEWLVIQSSDNVDRYVEILIDWSEVTDGINIQDQNYNKAGVMDICHVEKLTNKEFSADINMINYPFGSMQQFGSLPNLKNSAIIDVKFFGGDPNKFYSIGSMQKNMGNDKRWRILIHEWDIAKGEWIDGGATSSRCEWVENNYIQKETIETITLAKTRDIGFSGEITVDWSKLVDGRDYNFRNDSTTNFGFFHPLTLNQKKIDITRNTKIYTLNTNQTFFTNAYYSSRWYKKVIGADNVMSTNLYGQDLTLMFVGTQISADFVVENYGYNVYYSIDNSDPKILAVTSTDRYVLADNLSNTEHYLTIQAEVSYGTTSENSPFFSGKGSCNLKGFNVQTYPYFGKKGKILFFGDSITVGVGDSTGRGFAGICANKLQMNYEKIAQPGGALVRNDMRPFLPTLQQYFVNYADQKYALPEEADVVILNIGTNDSASVTFDEYQQALINTINRMKNRYLNVPIFVMRPFNGSRQNETINAAKLTNVQYINTQTWKYTTEDGVHPDSLGAISLGKSLANELISRLGFSYFLN